MLSPRGQRDCGWTRHPPFCGSSATSLGRRVGSDTLRAGPNITPVWGYRGGQPGRRSRSRPLVTVVLAGVVVRLRFLAAEAEMPDEEGMAGCHQ